MDLKAMLKKYANLIIHSGINLQKDQILCVSASLESAELVRLVAESAYKAGAKEVCVRWIDEAVSRLKYEYAPMSQFENVPAWFAAYNNDYAREGAGFLSIDSTDPGAFAGIDFRKPAAWRKAAYTACREYYDGMDMGRNTWCIVAASAPEWAKKVFPGCPEEEAVEKLWKAIFKAARVDTPDPAAAWDAHRRSFQRRIEYLNEMQFDRLHYKNSIGTDITIGMPKDHCWAGGGAETRNGVYYFPNMPTEEIFCSPDKDRADGTVCSALPLNCNGNLIDHFSLTFKDGRVTDFSAGAGYDTLKALIGTDEGSHHLGEVALIPKKSPISEMGILFYNTLFDENAACHFAIGNGFAECLKGGLDQSAEEQSARGLNSSATHVDFMLGTPDLSITGITKDGNEVPLFRDGNWAF